MTGLDIDGNGAVGQSSPPSYPLLSTGYSTAKSIWAKGKSYQIIKPVEELSETIASKVVAVVAKTTLADIDASLTPQLSKYDYKVSPMVENTVTFAEKKKTENEGLINLVSKVVPIQTANNVASVFYGIFLKNLEKVGKVLLIENPETSA